MNAQEEKTFKDIAKQRELCKVLSENLMDKIFAHEVARKNSSHHFHSWVDFKNQGINKTQIQQDIVRLRRELNILSQMLEG